MYKYIYIFNVFDFIYFLVPVDPSRPSLPGNFTAAMVPTAEVMAAVLVALPDKSSPWHLHIKRVWSFGLVFESYPLLSPIFGEGISTKDLLRRA